MSKKIKNWKIQGDHRPVAIIDAEKANEKVRIEKRKKMFDSFAIADLAIEVSKISVIDGIKGTNFRNPKMNQKIAKVETLLDDIQKSEIGQVVSMLPEYVDTMQNEHAVEVYRWFQLMAFYPTEHIRAFNDGVEKQNEDRRKGVEPEMLFTKEDLQKAFDAGMKEEYDFEGTEYENDGFNFFYKDLVKERSVEDGI